MLNLGGLAIGRKKFAEAEPWCQRALTVFEHTYGPSHVFVASALTCIGDARLGLHAPKAALPVLERAVAMWNTLHSGDAGKLAAELGLAEALWDASGDRERAIALATGARKGYVALGVKEKANLREIDDWFAAHAPARKPTP
jgi:hypothetical protein